MAPVDQVKKTGSLEDLLNELQEEMQPLAKHLKTARWQCQEYQRLHEDLPESSAILTVDFAENYLCRHQNEIQSAHWAYKQITVVPCVLQYHCQTRSNCQDLMTEYLVGLSDDLQHDAAFTKKVIDDALTHLQSKGITNVYIFSDGCSAHFKSKLPFYRLSSLAKDHPEILIERHFFGSGHGKSLSNSCGGTVKSAAARAVACGQVCIQNANEMMMYCTETLSLKSPQNDKARNPDTCKKEDHILRSFHVFNTADFDRSETSSLLETLTGTRNIHSMKVSEGTLHCIFLAFVKPV